MVFYTVFFALQVPCLSVCLYQSPSFSPSLSVSPPLLRFVLLLSAEISVSFPFQVDEDGQTTLKKEKKNKSQSEREREAILCTSRESPQPLFGSSSAPEALRVLITKILGKNLNPSYAFLLLLLTVQLALFHCFLEGCFLQLYPSLISNSALLEA